VIGIIVTRSFIGGVIINAIIIVIAIIIVVNAIIYYGLCHGF
jgi:hypothetical protein